MKHIVRIIAAAVAAAALLAGGAGLYIGDMAFEQFRRAPWDEILGIDNHSRENIDVMDELEREYGWEPVFIEGGDGTRLRGTYIEDGGGSDETVILIHGLYHNRAMSMTYGMAYRRLGMNVLLIDQRGHGESGGRTEWGLREPGDIAAWIAWLKERNSRMMIGLHGVSLGAAMALLYAGSSDSQAAFVIADSSYGDLVLLGREKLAALSGDGRAVQEYDMLMPFFNAAMWYHTGAVMTDIDPAHAAADIRCPVLFLHGQEDRLVPAEAAWELYEACGSADKYVCIFSGSPHAAGIETDRELYELVVTDFVRRAVQK